MQRHPLPALGRCLALAVAGLLGPCGRAADVPARMLLLDAAQVGSAVFAVGERGTILRSEDEARHWQLIAAPSLATLTGVSFTPDRQHGWVVGHDAVILATSDAGRTWQRQLEGAKKSAAPAAGGGSFSPTLEDSFLDVLALSPERVIAIGAYGLYVATADGGKTWSRQRILDDDYHLNRITRGPAGTLYIAGEHGTLLRSTDGGDKWQRIATPYDGSFYGLLPLDAHTLLVYGLRGRAFRSTNDGASWQAVTTPAPALFATAVKRRDGTLLLAGQARVLGISRDEGGSFSAVSDPPASAIAELLELPNGALLSLGEAGALLLTLGHEAPMRQPHP